MRAELKRKDQRYQNRTRWATVFFDHGQSTESLSWSKTDNRILEQAKIFCVVVSQRTRSVIYFMSHVSYSQLWYLSITHHIFCKFPSSVLDFIFTLPVFFEVQFSQFIRSVVSNSLRPREPQHTRTTYVSPAAGVHPNPCPRSWWCHPTISSSVVPFSCSQSFPPSGSFPMSQLFASGGQSIGVSASTSVLSNEQLGLICFGMDWLDLLAGQGTLATH